MFSEWIRKIGFYTIDAIRGGHILKHYKDISKKMNGEVDPLDELPKILSYAKENVPYYSNIKGDELRDFPVINKSDIMANYDSFISREYSNTKNLHWVSTSGSTGTPFKACQDARKRNRTIADLIYFHKLNGWELGDRYVFLRAWTSSYSVSKLKLCLQNFIPIDVINFDDKAKESLRQMLKKDKKIRVILGYASALQDFVNYLEQKGDNSSMFNIKVIFSVSDNLSNLTKQKLEKMFACPVINRYSNEEHGVLACTSKSSDKFILNTASYYFELLKLDVDEPVGPGEIGRIVVTDLYNRSMPFIRYDTGDLAISDDKDRNHIKTLSSLQGRVADTITDTKGNLISAVVVNNHLNNYYKIKKYQLVQDDKNSYIFKVVCSKDSYNSDELIEVCKSFLGEEAKVKIEYLDEIPIEHTGKFKTVVNCYRTKL